jgi:hypothetical protein
VEPEGGMAAILEGWQRKTSVRAWVAMIRMVLQLVVHFRSSFDGDPAGTNFLGVKRMLLKK